MPTRFQQRFQSQGLPVILREHSSQVQLRSGGDLSSAFTAKYENQVYESIEFETGLPVKTINRDYFLPVASCVINGLTVEPSRGMFIVEDAVEREILPPRPNSPAVELLAGGYRYLVHTKEVTGC